MQFVRNDQGDNMIVKMQGKFTFADREEIKKLVDDALKINVKKFILDFSEIEFIDSAGLGILLLINDQLKQKNIHINLHKPVGQVEKMFKISRFEEIFSITH